LGAAVGKKTATAANAGIVEEQIKLVGAVIAHHRLAKGQDLRLIGDIGHVRRNPDPLRYSLPVTELARLCHAWRRNIAHRYTAALGHKLAHQLAADPAASTRNYGKLARELAHSRLRLRNTG
jgi:hypothetical protein